MVYLCIKFLKDNFDRFVLYFPRLRTSRQITPSHGYRLNQLSNKNIPSISKVKWSAFHLRDFKTRALSSLQWFNHLNSGPVRTWDIEYASSPIIIDFPYGKLVKTMQFNIYH
jgi:hypothetical protein